MGGKWVNGRGGKGEGLEVGKRRTVRMVKGEVFLVRKRGGL